MRLPFLPLFLLLGATATAQVPVYEFTGIAPYDRGGYSVAGVGDVDGDGWDDVAVGIPYADAFGPDSGRVHVHSGRDGGLIRIFQGQAPGERFGWSVAGIGDVDGDGLGDLVVGAPWATSGATSQAGKVYVLSATGAMLWIHGGSASNDFLGTSVAGVGDVNGDGVPDYGYGIPGRDAGSADSGWAVVNSGVTGSFLISIGGFQAGELFGASIAGLGDVDGDGRDDLVIGAPGHDKTLPFKSDVGRAYVYGYKGGAATLQFVHNGSWELGRLGTSVAGLGDVNSDGIPDIAVGAPLADPDGNVPGEVRVISGKTTALLYTLTGFPNSRFGSAVAGLGDMDGDGVGELGVGSPSFSFLASTKSGLGQAFSGANGQLVYTWNGTQSGNQFGSAIAAAGDLNRDGRADAVVGAPFANAGKTEAGRAMVFLGSAPWPSTYCTAKVNSAGCTPSMSFDGAPSVSIADNFHIRATGVLDHTPGLMIWSSIPAATPFWGGGTLCVGAPVRRTTGQASGGVAVLPCSGSFDFHASQSWLASQGLSAGATVFAQYWSRDVGFAPPQNMNLTNGLGFTLVP